ncbi:MAG: D-isomer specific 2-hydroxyacid dehydrogenase family protein [Candidatus Dormibacteraceae bacterium]
MASSKWRPYFTEAVLQGGGEVAPPSAANALIWLDNGDSGGLVEVLDRYPAIAWVQLPWAGVETFYQSGLFDRPVRFTCAKGAYGEQVGEHALTLTLACLRHLVEQGRHLSWHPKEPESLFGRRVAILGAGGIALTYVRLLQPFGCQITALRRQAEPLPGADQTLTLAHLHSVLPQTEVLVLALALTPQTRRIIGARELALLPPGAVVINVARGGHIDTQALVASLRSGHLAAAGLDVTDPEPLPDDHPLWQMNNVLITSHCADSVGWCVRQLAERGRENVTRFAQNQPLIGLVDPQAGY